MACGSREREAGARNFALMAERRIETTFDRRLLDGPTVLLCSEATAEHCHRRLVLEYLQRFDPAIEPVHL